MITFKKQALSTDSFLRVIYMCLFASLNLL